MKRSKVNYRIGEAIRAINEGSYRDGFVYGPCRVEQIGWRTMRFLPILFDGGTVNEIEQSFVRPR